MVKIISRKRKAMSLVALLVSMGVLSVILAMFIPIMTKGYMEITTGKGGQGKINLTKTHGYFMCYRNASGQLVQKRADVSHTGQVTLTDEESVPSGCRFRIPKRADAFTLTLIGGGGGGAASNYSFDASNPIWSYDVPVNADGFVLRKSDFEDLGDYMNIDSLWDNLSANLEFLIKPSQTATTACPINFDALPYVNKDFINDSMIDVKYSINAKSKTSITYNGQNYIPNTNCTGTTKDYFHIGSKEDILSTDHWLTVRLKGASTSKSISESFQFQAVQPTFVGGKPLGGDAGLVVSNTISFLNPTDTATGDLVIPSASIGAGGAGGRRNAGGSCINNCKGSDGGTTSLRLGNVNYTAEGGAGGAYGATANISPDDGKIEAGVAHGSKGHTIAEGNNGFYLPFSLRIDGLSKSGVNYDCSNNCNAQGVTYPGTGGSAGSMRYGEVNVGNKAVSFFVNDKLFMGPNPVSSSVTNGQGGAGAPGAIVISW